MRARSLLPACFLLTLNFLLAACGSSAPTSSGNATATTSSLNASASTKLSISATILGMNQPGLVLNFNGKDVPVAVWQAYLVVAENLSSGSAYQIEVKQNPTGHTCTVQRGTGTLNNVSVYDVTVNCADQNNASGSTNRTPAAGAIYASLVMPDQTGLVLDVNEQEVSVGAGVWYLAVAKNLAPGTAYSVKVKNKPANYSCTVENGSGTMESSNVYVTVRCADPSINTTTPSNGSIFASMVVPDPDGIVLSVNNQDVLVGASVWYLSVAKDLSVGTPYSVTVKSKPTNYTCSVENGTGVMGDSNVYITVKCTDPQSETTGNNPTTPTTAPTPTSGSIYASFITPALEGLILSVNNQDIAIGGAEWYRAIASDLGQGSVYTVTVKQAPAGYTCNVENGTGTMGNSNVYLTVKCVNPQTTNGSNTTTPAPQPTTFSIYASYVVPALTDLILSVNNQDVPALKWYEQVASNLTTGTSYTVTVKQKPATYSCNVENGTGTIGQNSVYLIVKCTNN